MAEKFTRKLGRSQIEVSALGMGCWAIGGPFYYGGKPDGWGNIDDEESVKAIQTALDLGINFFDTADAYGVGHSEEVLGKALAGRRNEAVISTKFAHFGNSETKTLNGTNISPSYIEKACDASLKRLKTDYIDVYLLHEWNIGVADVETVCSVLEKLVEKGKIRTYGWSTDLVDGAVLFARRKNCSVIQHCLNVFEDAPEMLKFCAENNLASINRSPLAMGFLSGKFDKNSVLPQDDVRGAGHEWVPYFKNGRPSDEFMKMLDSVKEILTSKGRTPAQGALGWIWGKSEITIPIPGFKTVKQVEENAKALQFGPLTKNETDEIESILKRI